jgi:hypothetical protein
MMMVSLFRVVGVGVGVVIVVAVLMHREQTKGSSTTQLRPNLSASQRRRRVDLKEVSYLCHIKCKYERTSLLH